MQPVDFKWPFLWMLRVSSLGTHYKPKLDTVDALSRRPNQHCEQNPVFFSGCFHFRALYGVIMINIWATLTGFG